MMLPQGQNQSEDQSDFVILLCRRLGLMPIDVQIVRSNDLVDDARHAAAEVL